MCGDASQPRIMTEAELRDTLVRVPATREGGDDFFGHFLYVQELINGNYSSALNHGLELLQLCQRLAPDAYERIHKGTPYYWLGMTAFLVHDYQTAAFFFDAGVSEDLRMGADPVANSTPGLRFIQIEADQPDQAAQQLVQATREKVERAIAEYNARPGRPAGVPPLQLNGVRERFLRPAVSAGGERLRTLATAFISFFLEWDHRSLLMKLRGGEGTTEPFFLHLFKGCLLFESLLKANPTNAVPPNTQLGRVLQHLHQELGIPHDIQTTNFTFPAIMASLPTADNSIPTAIEFAARVRNTLGHDLGWNAALDTATYNRLAGMVASSCLHAIACLYR
jgi:hypothetical protein